MMPRVLCAIAVIVAVLSGTVSPAVGAGSPEPPSIPVSDGQWQIESTLPTNDPTIEYTVLTSGALPKGDCLAVDLTDLADPSSASPEPDFEACFGAGTLQRYPSGPLEDYGYATRKLSGRKVLVVLLQSEGERMVGRFSKGKRLSSEPADATRIAVLVYPYSLRLRTLRVEASSGAVKAVCKVSERSLSIRCPKR